VTGIGILLGGFYVLLAIPIACGCSRRSSTSCCGYVDPAAADVPSVMFTAARED